MSSIPSSAATLEDKKKFAIPQKWKPSISAAISKKRLTPDVRNEIVRDLVTHVYGCVGRPSASFVTKIADMLVDRYPFMADSSDTAPSVSSNFVKIVAIGSHLSKHVAVLPSLTH